MDRCHLYLPLVDASGALYPYAEVTLLDSLTGLPIEEPVYLDPRGGAPESWPVLVDPAVINLWAEKPMRVTVQALLPGGATLTRAGVDIAPSPTATVRTAAPVQIGSSEGLDGTAMLTVSPNGMAVWQVLDVLRFHRHEGAAPDSTVLTGVEPADIYPEQTWLGPDINGPQGVGASALGGHGRPSGPGATGIGSATAFEDSVAAGRTAAAIEGGVALGAASVTGAVDQVALGRGASTAAAQEGAVAVGAGAVAGASDAVLASGVRVLADGSVVLGQGPLPDLSWLGSQFVALLGNAVAGRFFAARASASLAGTGSTFGVFGAAGVTRPMMANGDVASNAQGRAALLSLLSAFDQLGLIYLTDLAGAIQDPLSDWTKTLQHDANLVIETGDANGSYLGDLSRIKRNAAPASSLTYRITGGIRDFAVQAYTTSNDLTPEVTAQISPDNTTWTTVPISWQPLTPTPASWKTSWGGNAYALPASATHLRLTLGGNAVIYAPQVGRVIVRQRL